ncbi:MAG: cyclic-di-AMP receptor [Anaerolineae bacterium]|nr:cyclic-di-AMP receptor [Anaerolineae bacterium]
MKLVLAVVQDIDADAVMAALTEAGESVTRVASTGGFFRQGNSTLLCATEDDRVDGVITVLKKVCHQRSRLIPVSLDPGEAVLTSGAYTEVTVGGATILVFNIERFDHI